MHPHAPGAPSILVSFGVVTSPTFAAIAAENEELGGPALFRHLIAIHYRLLCVQIHPFTKTNQVQPTDTLKERKRRGRR